jgi:ectoine hydroxylase-related dioxygenase (phytanoyl-CoA dioxygenase family)
MLVDVTGVGAGTDGTVHHLPCAGGAFLELLEWNGCHPLLEGFFQGRYILNTFGGVLNLPSDLSYVGRIHRDLRTFSGDVNLMAQLLVMLDDFTEENGATYLLSGSHRFREEPEHDLFFRDAARALGSAGSIVVFNSNLWHAAGVNRSAVPRRALTIAFTRPFVKQQLDYPRALGFDRAEAFSPELRQLLGYNARVPTSLDEWYQPPDKRLYKRDQG